MSKNSEQLFAIKAFLAAGRHGFVFSYCILTRFTIFMWTEKKEVGPLSCSFSYPSTAADDVPSYLVMFV